MSTFSVKCNSYHHTLQWYEEIISYDFFILILLQVEFTLMITGNFGMFIDKQKNLHLSCKVLEPRDGECTEWLVN